MTTGILLLHGSSGAPDLGRARMLTAAGYDVLAPKWFEDRISEIPLESFPLDELAERNDRLVVMGLSRGAEAALLLGTRDDRIDAVIACAPTAYMWGWIGEGGVQTSPWTWQGEPLPFVPFDLDWRPTDNPPSYVEHYRQSLRRYAEQAAAAEIPAERFKGDLLLLAGGDDRVWPSVEFAEQLVRRRGTLPTQVLSSAEAGHRIVFPGEEPKSAGQRMARGGSEQADRAFGGQVWADVELVLAGTR
ncbi:acyl-CoA thioester hydrolase/BAAT C-terminal domain-containing protein [Kribbella sp. NPDC056861]|uniref:acyl-CoA thioester hydrolase/BAAT C-terminal domain-containing protein n=1 Tax=Kribbella sp. NPDC056861 TaxID=3154857 RepID=UPI003435D334